MIFNLIAVFVILVAVIGLRIAYQKHPEIKPKRFSKIFMLTLFSIIFFLIALYLSLYVIK